MFEAGQPEKATRKPYEPGMGWNDGTAPGFVGAEF
jgi:hypothetical protein